MLDGMTNIKASEVLKEIKYYTEDLPPYSPDEVAEALEMAIKALEQQSFINKPCVSEGVCREDKIQVLEKIRAEIKAKIEEEEFARSVFRHEEKDTYKAEQCTGSIMAYNNVIKLIDKYGAESEDEI